jgi:hypothetical protein
MTPVDAGNMPKVAVHGTSEVAARLIMQQGMLPGGPNKVRTHNHFATTFPRRAGQVPGHPDARAAVSGLRATAQVFILLDIQKCLEESIPLFLTNNDVLRTTHVLKEQHFKNIIVLGSMRCLLKKPIDEEVRRELETLQDASRKTVPILPPQSGSSGSGMSGSRHGPHERRYEPRLLGPWAPNKAPEPLPGGKGKMPPPEPKRSPPDLPKPAPPPLPTQPVTPPKAPITTSTPQFFNMAVDTDTEEDVPKETRTSGETAEPVAIQDLPQSAQVISMADAEQEQEEVNNDSDEDGYLESNFVQDSIVRVINNDNQIVDLDPHDSDLLPGPQLESNDLVQVEQTEETMEPHERSQEPREPSHGPDALSDDEDEIEQVLSGEEAAEDTWLKGVLDLQRELQQEPVHPWATLPPMSPPGLPAEIRQDPTYGNIEVHLGGNKWISDKDLPFSMSITHYVLDSISKGWAYIAPNSAEGQSISEALLGGATPIYTDRGVELEASYKGRPLVRSPFVPTPHEWQEPSVPFQQPTSATHFESREWSGASSSTQPPRETSSSSSAPPAKKPPPPTWTPRPPPKPPSSEKYDASGRTIYIDEWGQEYVKSSERPKGQPKPAEEVRQEEGAKTEEAARVAPEPTVQPEQPVSAKPEEPAQVAPETTVPPEQSVKAKGTKKPPPPFTSKLTQEEAILIAQARGKTADAGQTARQGGQTVYKVPPAKQGVAPVYKVPPRGAPDASQTTGQGGSTVYKVPPERPPAPIVKQPPVRKRPASAAPSEEPQPKVQRPLPPGPLPEDVAKYLAEKAARTKQEEKAMAEEAARVATELGCDIPAPNVRKVILCEGPDYFHCEEFTQTFRARKRRF